MLTRLMSLRDFRGFFLTFILGGLSVLGFAPFYLWPVTIVCLALLMLRLDGAADAPKPLKAGFWQGFAFGLGYFLFGLYWIGSAFIARGPAFIPYMPFAILALAAGLALFWGGAGALYMKLAKSGHSHPLRAVIFACLLFIAEYIRGHLFGGFPWNLPGYIFEAGKPVSQIASIVGIYGVSALVLFLSASLALAISGRKFIQFGAALAVLASTYAFGAARLKNASVEYVPGVKLRIVHANIPQKDKFDPNKYVQIIEHYFGLSTSAGFDDVTHIIWPEGAVPGLMFEDEGLMQALDQLMQSGTGAPPTFITQTLRAETVPGRDKPRYYNSAAAVTFEPGQAPQISAYYDKQKLVPFGEFMPGGGVLEAVGLKSLSTALESMTPGRSGTVPDLPGLPPVSLQICYEILFPGFTPQTLPGKDQKPQWILNLSNDSWYGNSTGPRQQINQAAYRAIEQALPVVRSTSGGISGVVDPFGRLLSLKNLDENGVLDTQLPRPVQKSAYKTSLNHIIALILSFMLLGCYAGLQRAR